MQAQIALFCIFRSDPSGMSWLFMRALNQVLLHYDKANDDQVGYF